MRDDGYVYHMGTDDYWRGAEAERFMGAGVWFGPIVPPKTGT